MKRLLSMAFLCSVLLAATALESQAVEIIAHRGASHDAPENTMSSLKLGWEQKADVVEFDVYLSKDGQIVLMHDATTKRTGGVDRKVVEQTFEELRGLDVGKWKDARFTGEKIPTLDEVLATTPNDPSKRYFIEVKCGAEIISALKTSLEKSGKPASQLNIIGAGFETMSAIKKALPQYPAYYVKNFKQDKETKVWTVDVDKLIQEATTAGFEGVDVNAKAPQVNAEFIRKVKAAGLTCYAWTIDSPERARELVAYGIDGITTNRALWLREQLEQPATH